MAHLRDRSFGLPRIPGHRLAWLVALPLLILTLSAQSGGSLDQAPAETATPAAANAAPSTGAPADPAAVMPAAAIVTPAAKPETDDRQRRVLMLLLMNSAGPVRPYGNLGR